MKTKIFLTALIIFTGFFGFSQTKQDSIDIEKTTLDYLDGYYTANKERMTNALHEKLSKRALLKNKKGEVILYEMTAEQLINAAANKPDDSKKTGELDYKFIILDIYKNNASVKIVSKQLNFFDYAHLLKQDGKWKIINVLWGFK